MSVAVAVAYLLLWGLVARELLALVDDHVLEHRVAGIVLAMAIFPPVLVAITLRWAWLGWRPWRRQPWPRRGRAGSRR